MPAITSYIVDFLSLLTVIGQIFSLVLVFCFMFGKGKTNMSPLFSRISHYGLFLLLIVAATATMGSLYFSEIALWTPCRLCWLQRIFMYSQVPLIILALWKRDAGIASYILLLSLCGIIFSIVHYSEQVYAALHPFIDPSKPCDTTGVSCSGSPFFHFGYITIPLMALTAFLMNALVCLFVMNARRFSAEH